MKNKSTVPKFHLEKKQWDNGKLTVAGVDEAGRGPIAGPVVVAAVAFDPNQLPEEGSINDSKKLSPSQRLKCFEQICKQAKAYKIMIVSAEWIDQINILQATLMGMKRAVETLYIPADYVLVDGKQYPEIKTPGETVVKGDSISMSIAAASVLAKVTRDRIMQGYAQLYPEWQLDVHKGYPTKKHLNAIQKYGITPIHRRSFRSCLPFIKNTNVKQQTSFEYEDNAVF